MTSLANGELGSTVRSKLNSSLTVTDAFTVSGANVGIGAGAGDFGNTGKFAVQTASSTDGVVATFANSGLTGATIQFFQNGISTANIGMPAGVAALTFAPNGATERMRITDVGNVGIGTTSPSGKLHVEGASTVANLIASSGNGVFRLADSAAGATRKEFTITLDNTNNRVAMEAVQQGVGFRDIAINPQGGNVGIGTYTPNAASILDAQSTTKGVRFPNMTTTQKAAIANVAGNVVFDTTLGKLCVNSGSGWQTITSV